jgi:hypothetical protein
VAACVVGPRVIVSVVAPVSLAGFRSVVAGAAGVG